MDLKIFAKSVNNLSKFLNFAGPYIKIRTIDPLRNTTNGRGVKHQPLIHFGCREILKNSLAVRFKKPKYPNTPFKCKLVKTTL